MGAGVPGAGACFLGQQPPPIREVLPPGLGQPGERNGELLVGAGQFGQYVRSLSEGLAQHPGVVGVALRPVVGLLAQMRGVSQGGMCSLESLSRKLHPAGCGRAPLRRGLGQVLQGPGDRCLDSCHSLHQFHGPGEVSHRTGRPVARYVLAGPGVTPPARVAVLAVLARLPAIVPHDPIVGLVAPGLAGTFLPGAAAERPLWLARGYRIPSRAVP